MIDYGTIGSTVKPKEKAIDDYSVWLNTEIETVSRPDFSGYQYHSVRYDKNEYIGLIENRTSALETLILQLGGVI